MGNCNFKTEKDNSELCKIISNNIMKSNNKESLWVPIPDRARRLRQGLACAEQKEQIWGLRHEGDVQGTSHGKEERAIRHERT